MNILKENVFNKKDYVVRTCPIEMVRSICKTKHYLKRVPSILAHYGLYYRNDMLLGVITFGIPPNQHLMQVCGDNYKRSVLELNRLWCYDEAPRNSESFLIAQSIKLLKKERPEIKILISFADTREGHLGYIYQASNWYFAGWSVPGGGSIMINGEEYHAKSLNNKYGTSNIKKLKRILKTQNIFYRPRSKKCRYIYFISKDKRENEKLKKLCKYKIQDYPKELPDEVEYKTLAQKNIEKKKTK